MPRDIPSIASCHHFNVTDATNLEKESEKFKLALILAAAIALFGFESGGALAVR